MATNNKGYDPNKDYSTAIEAAKKAGQSTAQLEAERAAKIADMYGGKEPTYNGTNQTYSQYSAAQSSASKPATATSSTGGSSGSSSSSSATSQLQNAVSSGITKASGGSYNGIPLQNTTGTVKDSITHDYSRKPELAGQVVIQNNQALYYDDNGYMTKAVALGSNSPAAAQAVKDLNDRGVYTGAQQTWANVTGNDVSASYGKSGTELYDGYTAGAGQSGGAATSAVGGTAAGTSGAAQAAGSYGQNTDYSDLIKAAISSGADASYVQQILNARNAKIYAAGGSLDQYYNDAVSQAAQQYITDANNNAYLNQLIAALNGGQTGQGAALAGSGMTFDDYLNSSGYNSAMESMDAANQAALQQLQAQADLQSSQVNSGYDDAARQAYITYMQSRRTLPQRLSAAGMNGGLADSQQIALDAELQNNQAQINQQRQTALQELQNTLLNGQLSANQTYLGSLANLQQNAAGSYQSYAQNQQALQNENYWNERNLALQTEQISNSLKQQDWENAIALMQVLGYADEDIAQVLKIAQGTTTNDADYRSAQLQMALLGL